MESGPLCLGIDCALSVCNDQRSRSTILHESTLVQLSFSLSTAVWGAMEIPSVLYR